MKKVHILLGLILCMLMPSSAFAAGDVIDGKTLSLWWGLPFVGILLSLAIMPLFAPDFWHKHFGKIAAGWIAAFLLPCFFKYGEEATLHVISHVLFLEYLPFIILLFALFTITGGIRIQAGWHGKPHSNVMILAFGAMVASWIGTTGASMLLIHPLIKANRWRQHKTHVIIFFIFLVSNIGGALTPLGDPPLFLGFLNGVSFFWTTQHLFGPFLFVGGSTLALFYLVDTWFYKRDKGNHPHGPREPMRISGELNFVLLLGVLGSVLMSGMWHPDIYFNVHGVQIELQNPVRDFLLIGFAILSLKYSKRVDREANHFNWEPMKEIVKIFIAIFVTVAPVISMLHAGLEGPFNGLIAMATCDGEPTNSIYFWLTGVLSSFLDNAPTYLVFFHMASGDAAILMGKCYKTLVAISAGSVFMGAMTYIGNAPNFMVRSIAEQRGIKMPSFFGYMAWSVSILCPIFILLTLFHFM